MSVLGSSFYIEVPSFRHFSNSPSQPNRPSSASTFRPTSTSTSAPTPSHIKLIPPTGPTSLPQQQTLLPPTPVSLIDNKEVVEDNLSFREAQFLGKSRVRKTTCFWRDCDAQLASIDVLQKHLDRHVSDMHASELNLGPSNDNNVEHEHNDNGNDADHIGRELGIKCQWERCPQYGFTDYDALRQHISIKYINKLINDHCPHKDCAKKPTSDQIQIHADRHHPGPWSRDVIRPKVADPHKPSLSDRQTPFSALRLPTQIPRYMISCPPVQPFRKPKPIISAPSLAIVTPRSGPSRVTRPRVSSETTYSEQEEIHPIICVRDPDDFWPVHGEPDFQTGLYPLTSSIFPPLNPIVYTDTEKHWRKTQASGKYNRHPTLTISKKTSLPRRPLVFSGTDVWVESRREEFEREKTAKYDAIRAMAEETTESGAETKPELGPDPKGKRKAVDEIAPEQQPKRYAVDRVTRASANRATRLVGRSIGIERFEEMIPFERRGIEWGYLPPDFPLTK